MLLRCSIVLALAAPAASLRLAGRGCDARSSLRLHCGPPRASSPVLTAGEPPSPSTVVDSERFSRTALAALATVGAIETGALTIDKLWGTSVTDGLCLAAGGGCTSVLSGPWSSLLGVPLSLVGFVAYASVAALAAAPLLTSSGDAESASTDAGDASNAPALLVCAGGLATFSTALMALLVVVIRQPCVLCITSAALSLGIFAVAWQGPLARSRTQAAVCSSTGAALSIVAAGALFFSHERALADVDASLMATVAGARGGATAAMGEGAAEARRPPTTRSRSSSRALQIARQLSERGGRFYGAYWCSHCANQKETLGKEAMALVPYLECDANGVDSKRSQCSAAGIRGYPTWELDGQLYPGERDLNELEAMLAGKVEPQGLAGA